MKPTSISKTTGGLGMKWIMNNPARSRVRIILGCRSVIRPSLTVIPSTPPSVRRGGFALVATLALMILLTLVAVGLLSLSAVSLRSGSQSRAESEARANARMALMFAIGELQKHTGQDTRVTAPADIVDPNAPTLTGVWKSWEGTDHDGTGRPIKPDYSVKTKNESDNGRFLTWLVSGAESGTAPSSPSPSTLAFKESSNDRIPLLTDGTLGKGKPGQVHVRPQLLKNNTGAFAWWVSPENQKARLVQPHKPRTSDIAGLVGMGQSHPVSNPGVFGLESLIDDQEEYIPDPNYPKPAGKAFTLRTTKLLASSATSKPQERFHDLSTSAVGLLTNAATGGWRKDLSLLTEKWDSIYGSYPSGKLPLFRFTPKSGDTSKVPKPTASSYDPAQSNLYPWSAYSVIIGQKLPSTYQAASASWQSLASFATTYKNITYNAGSVTSPFVWDKILSQNASSLGGQQMFNYNHKQRLYPQIARFQFLVYVKAIEDPARLNQNPKKYQLRLMYVPLFTLWNPYNLTLEHTISGTQNAGQGSGAHTNFLGFGWRRSPPGAMAIASQTTFPNPDAVPASQYRLFTPGNFQVLDKTGNYANPYDTELNASKGFGNKWVDKRTFGCWLPEGKLTFKPGEVKVFSPGWSDPAYGLSGVLRLEEGYDPEDIIGSEFAALSNLLGNQSFWFLMRTDRVTQPFINRIPGNGFSLSFADGSDHFGANGTMPTGPGNEFHNITSLASENDAQKYWPPDEVAEVGYSVAQLSSGRWFPLFSISFGPRMTIGTGQGTDQNRPTKGVVQNNALASMVLSDPASNKAKDYPANNTFDFAYHSLAAGDNITPNLSKSAGYIATGYQSGDGLSRLIMVDIPLRPMASLVELQGWNPRGNNPYPPFQMNLIGNSDATPLIPNDNIVPSVLEPSGVASNLQHDDAYCANHLLFDDWFVSSIAPQPQVLGGNISKDIETFYRDFLTNKERLANRSYKAIGEDTNLTDALASDRIQKIIKHHEGWLKVASRLEVDGMFNVNSTSIEAWKALLGHAKSRENIAMYGKDRMESTSINKSHPVTRGAVASDVESGKEPAVGGSIRNASEYTGFRNLTDDQIGDLAAKIVEQIRLRGPFLSLSEFVNRQLSSDNNLALAGAVQIAINNLDKDPMKVLRNPNNGLSDNTMATKNPSDSKVKDAKYAFLKAAEGSSAFGAPGWIRQADVLRPIAPILSARDDTFTIRAYGASKDSAGNIVAKAWCEAVVKRTRDYCDPTDAADSIEPPASPANAKFGRRYQIVSFRWLHPDEV